MDKVLRAIEESGSVFGIIGGLLSGLILIYLLARPHSWNHVRQLLARDLALSVDITRARLAGVGSVLFNLSYLKQSHNGQDHDTNVSGLDVYDRCMIFRFFFWISDGLTRLWLVAVVFCLLTYSFSPLICAVAASTYLLIMTPARLAAKEISKQVDETIVGSKPQTRATLKGRGLDICELG